MIMETPTGAETAHQLNNDKKLTQPETLSSTVHNITAKFFLNRPPEDLVPARYLRQAESIPTVQRKAWIFRNGTEDAHHVDLNDWSRVDIRYRGVFKTLAKAPRFSKGLWDGGCEECQEELNGGKPSAQAQVVYALLNEVCGMLDLQRPTSDGDAIFYLTPRLLSCRLEYWTGYREKYKDGPETAGFLSLEYDPELSTSNPILPVSTTMREQSLLDALTGKFKLLLGQLLIHVRPLPFPADKIPDQEIFLVGLHGSKLHIMRAFFPGQKISSLWCRRDVPGPNPVFHSLQLQPPPQTHLLTPQRPQSPSEPYATHIEDCATASHTKITSSRDNDQDPLEMVTGSTITHPTSNITNSENSPADTQYKHTHNNGSEPQPLEVYTANTTSRTRSNSARFYAAENIERLHLHLDDLKLRALDHELHPRTIRILATREYDLWLRDDFTAAVHVLVALQMYLLSGHARCGGLQETFQRHPVRCVNGESPDGDEVKRKSKSDLDYFCGPSISEEVWGAESKRDEWMDMSPLRRVETERKPGKNPMLHWEDIRSLGNHLWGDSEEKLARVSAEGRMGEDVKS